MSLSQLNFSLLKATRQHVFLSLLVRNLSLLVRNLSLLVRNLSLLVRNLSLFAEPLTKDRARGTQEHREHLEHRGRTCEKQLVKSKKERLRRGQRALNWGLRPQTPARGLHPWTRRPEEQKRRPGDDAGKAAARTQGQEQKRLIGGRVATLKAAGTPKRIAPHKRRKSKAKSKSA